MKRIYIGIFTLLLILIPLNTGAEGTFSATPLNDLGTDTYLGFEGGLYPNGSNTIPPSHASAGNLAATNILPRATNGSPDPNGTYILLSIGMSNVNQEFCGSSDIAIPCNAWTFMPQAAADPNVNHTTLTILNGAAGGQVAFTWDAPDDLNYDRIRDTILTPLGYSENQVQVIWGKMANPNPNNGLPNIHSDANVLLMQWGDILRALKTRYPNLQQVFLTSRNYAGYATSTLNPEPYAYESGFAVKWTIGAQINQMNGGGLDPTAGDLDYTTIAPWISWGPYLWADGLNPRSDGLTWAIEEFEADGTHPSQLGETKIATMLLDFFLNSPQTLCWFRAGQTCAFEPTNFLFLPIVLNP